LEVEDLLVQVAALSLCQSQQHLQKQAEEQDHSLK